MCSDFEQPEDSLSPMERLEREMEDIGVDMHYMSWNPLSHIEEELDEEEKKFGFAPTDENYKGRLSERGWTLKSWEVTLKAVMEICHEEVFLRHLGKLLTEPQRDVGDTIANRLLELEDNIYICMKYHKLEVRLWKTRERKGAKK